MPLESYDSFHSHSLLQILSCHSETLKSEKNRRFFDSVTKKFDEYDRAPLLSHFKFVHNSLAIH